MLIAILLSYVKNCEGHLGKRKQSPHQRLKDRSNIMTEGLMPFPRRKGTWSWLKLRPTSGRGK